MIQLYRKSKNNIDKAFKIQRKKHVQILTEAKPSSYPKFDGSINFNIYDNIYAPKSIGVYFVHDARGILYIGRSINIYKRFTQHSWIRKNKDLYNLSKNPLGKLKFSWVKTKDEKMAEKLEENWVKMFLPFCNDILFNNR